MVMIYKLDLGRWTEIASINLATFDVCGNVFNQKVFTKSKLSAAVSSVTRKNRQIFIKVAQKWFHYKNYRFWHLYKNCLRMWKIGANLLLPKALKSCPKSKKSPNLVTLAFAVDTKMPFWKSLKYIVCYLCKGTVVYPCNFLFKTTLYLPAPKECVTNKAPGRDHGWWSSGHCARSGSSNPTEAYSYFCKMQFENNVNLQREAQVRPFYEK